MINIIRNLIHTDKHYTSLNLNAMNIIRNLIHTDKYYT